MRWIFLSLVLLNLAALLLFWGQPTNAVRTDRPVTLAGGESLTLVSESDVSLPVRQAAQTTQPRQNLCFLLGPYQDGIDANYARARAEALNIRGVTRQTELPTEQAGDFWVYVPPRASREEARQLLRELQQRKIDSYIINSGDLSDGISLGLFSQEASAQEVAERVAAFDIPVAIRTQNETRQEHWLQVAQHSELSERLRQRIMAEDEGVSWQMSDCLD